MSKPIVKMYGLPRSGTNALASMMEKHMGVEIGGSRKHGWKHGLVIDTGIPSIGIVKDPYAWWVSVWRWRTTQNPLPFNQWVRKSSDPVLWCLMHQHWLDKGITFVRFEDLLVQPQQVMAKVSKATGIEIRSEVVRPQGVVNKARQETDKVFNVAHYLKRKYMDIYTVNALRCFGERVDIPMVEKMGYEYLVNPEVESKLKWKKSRKP
jgi:hypothetical protein